MQPSLTGTVWGTKTARSASLKFEGKELKQKRVHEHTARERDGFEAFARADLARDVGRSVRNGDVKPEGEPVDRRAASIPFRRASMSGWGSKMWESSADVNMPV